MRLFNWVIIPKKDYNELLGQSRGNRKLQWKAAKLRDSVHKYQRAAERRNDTLAEWNKLFRVMLEDGRLTKEELAKYSPPRTPKI